MQLGHPLPSIPQTKVLKFTSPKILLDKLIKEENMKVCDFSSKLIPKCDNDRQQKQNCSDTKIMSENCTNYETFTSVSDINDERKDLENEN